MQLVLVRALIIAAVFTQSSTVWGEASEESERVFKSIEVYPERLELSSIRDARRLLVTGVTEDGQRIDLTLKSMFRVEGDCCQLDGDGYINPSSAGEGSIVVEVAGIQAVVPVKVASAEPVAVDFIREVNPVLGKAGCNQGTCHGSQSGKNGFKLSLRGYDALYDYRALVDDISGRRFNRSVPNQSLMLLKPTQGVPHEGGFLFDEQSRYYKLIEQWIAEGCQFNEQAARVTGIVVYPPTPLLQSSGDEQQLSVIATYADGTSRDVTRDAVFETSNFEVATVSKSGLVRAVRRGEAAALVRYEGHYAAAPVAILGNRDGYEWNESAELNFVDGFVNAKLQRMKILPSELADDASFLRRVSLDIAGITPTQEQTLAFINDPAERTEKRRKKIDELLNHPGYVDHWTLKWSDLLLARRKAITERGVWAFRNWIRNAVATNLPYDKFASELILASGSTIENPAGNYYRIAREPKLVMENMTQVFLGTRFNCNQCHDHPFERWTQRQYYELAAYFAEVGRKPAADGDEIIYTRATPEAVINPDTNQPASPQFPFLHSGEVESDGSRRKQLAQWLTADENPYFARSAVNRYWSYFFGRGIIDPVDDIRASNPASNPELLDALTKDFVEHQYDLKRLIRLICNSAAYQRSLETNKWNEDDNANFSHSSPRRLTAEQLYDAIMQATGAPRNLPGVPAGFRAAQLPDPQVEVAFLDMFGRPPRELPCECERNSDVSLSQTLNMINGPTISDAIIHPNGVIARTMASGADNKELVRTIYLSTLCRLPADSEMEKSLAYFDSVGTPREAAEDLMWALINSPAFLFNR
ncbi:MAG: DUF1553 domain-containing protein [Planctomycetaceae bacterium]|nr:DUF1553 domain-containing protein [Planctomycetaceae bacterium]